MKWKSLSRVQFFVTPWTVASQAALFIGFSRQRYWSGLHFSPPIICIYTSVILTSLLLCVQFITYSCDSKSCLVGLCDPMDYTAHEILQARILEWVAIPFSRGSSQPRYWTQVSRMAAGFFTIWATRETSLSSWKHGLRSSYLGVAGHGVSRALIWAEWPSENVFLFKISQYLI